VVTGERGPRCAPTDDSAYHLIKDLKKYISDKRFLAEEDSKIIGGLTSRLEQPAQAEPGPANMDYDEDSTPKTLADRCDGTIGGGCCGDHRPTEFPNGMGREL